MRVLDFDNTIYKGESAFDFYMFSIRYNPRVLKFLLIVLMHLLRYKWGKSTLEELDREARKYATAYLRAFPDLPKITRAFWDKKQRKLKAWYTPQPDDVILTASFNIIMDDICARLGVQNCISSQVNRETLEVEYINFSQNKREIFEKTYGKGATIDEFYTDNLFDLPMIKIAQKAFLVKGDKIEPIQK